jgi:hypothetical protein
LGGWVWLGVDDGVVLVLVGGVLQMLVCSGKGEELSWCVNMDGRW